MGCYNSVMVRLFVDICSLMHGKERRSDEVIDKLYLIRLYRLNHTVRENGSNNFSVIGSDCIARVVLLHL